MPTPNGLLTGSHLNFSVDLQASPEIRRGQSSPSASRQARRWTPAPPAPITAVVLTCDSADRLGEVLSALRWCDEVLIVDTGSTDQTERIAGGFANVRFERLTGPFPGFGRVRRHAVALARNDWILSVDSDEVVSEALADEIRSVPMDRRIVYSIPFENIFDGKRITACGWSPDRHERLFNRTQTNFCLSSVHEKVRTEHMVLRRLRSPIRHYSYRSLDDFLRKMRSYSALFASQNRGSRSSSPAKAVARSAWAFFRSYLLRRGFLAGYAGLAISAYQAQTVFWKHLMLYEATRRAG